MKKFIDKIFNKLGYTPKLDSLPIKIEESPIELIKVEREISTFELLSNKIGHDNMMYHFDKMRNEILNEVSKHIVFTEERLDLWFKHTASIKIIKTK